jgi:hypothetical protein
MKRDSIEWRLLRAEIIIDARRNAYKAIAEGFMTKEEYLEFCGLAYEKTWGDLFKHNPLEAIGILTEEQRN